MWGRRGVCWEGEECVGKEGCVCGEGGVCGKGGECVVKEGVWEWTCAYANNNSGFPMLCSLKLSMLKMYSTLTSSPL